MTKQYSVGLVGATGRLGTLVEDVIAGMDGYVVVARPGHETDWSLLDDVDVVVDASNLEASVPLADYCVEAGKKLVIGTSGWTTPRVDRLRVSAAAHPDAGVLIVPNFAVGSVLTTRLAAKAARIYPDVEIIEEHHMHKVDAPSGTAIRTREVIDEERPAGSRPITIHSVRLPGIVARQTMILGGEGEIVTITHETTSNSAYVRGIRLALTEAPSLSGVTVGLDDLMGIE